MNIEQEKAAKIMIVDDEPGNIHVLERMLKKAGYERLRSTSDSRNALEIYNNFSPDLILLDIKMPHVDGFEVMEQLKAHEHDNYLPILMLTALADPKTRLRALKKGAKDFLTKPFDMAETLVRIRNMLDVRLLHNQVRDQNRVLEERVEERTRELNKSHTEIIHRLARAAEYRDNETSMHTVRMGLLSVRLAHGIGLSHYECGLLHKASPMHDIGKIGIPDSILLKPGKLDPEEWEIMKTHSQIGADIIAGSQSELLQMSEVIALTHHERWDGTGYPRGLKGEEIPLIGRIVALCDVFDALTSDRPYKKAFSIQVSVKEIKSQSGKHFDPRLVKLFLKILPDMVDILKRFADGDEVQHKKPDWRNIN